ncbi:potassium channel family protein [candidate division KSB1 bacterium]
MAVKKQFYFALFLVISFMIVATSSYYLMSDPGKTIFDAMYHSLITLTTIGYTDTGFGTTQAQKNISVILISYSFFTQVVFAASILNIFISIKMHVKISEALMKFKFKFKRKHIVIFGVNKVAPYIINELLKTDTPCIAVSKDEAVKSEIEDKLKGANVLYWPDKHFSQKLFEDVNIKNARVAIVDLGNDETNHITSDLIREQNPNIKIIAVGDDISYGPIIKKRGNEVVNPHFMCAMRIASLAMRPAVVTFLDLMLYKKDGTFRIEEVEIPEKSPLAGKTYSELDLPHNFDLLPVGEMEKNKEINILILPENKIKQTSSIFVQGETKDINLLRDVADGQVTFKDAIEERKKYRKKQE